MKALTPRLRALSAEIARRPKVLLLLDFDGTLAPIRPRPELARLAPRARATLSRLNAGSVSLVFISGRSVASLKERVGLPGAGYCGVFGLDVSLPGWRYLHPAARARRPRLAGLIRELRRLFRGVPGALIEDKRAGAAVHYRTVPRARLRDFAARLARARAGSARAFAWRRGDYAWEVSPRTDWDKGRAALMLWRRAGRPYLLGIGNDRSDEPMLRAAGNRGAAIKVGEGASRAGYRLKDPGDVHRFLSAVETAIMRRAPLEPDRDLRPARRLRRRREVAP